MKPAIALCLALLLCACESEAEHKTKWLAWCTEHETSYKQCEVLYEVAKAAHNAEIAATVAQINSGVAMGLAAGSMGRR